MVVGVSVLLKSSAAQTHEQDKAQHWGAGDPGPTGDTPSQMESSVFIGTQDGNISQNNQS